MNKFLPFTVALLSVAPFGHAASRKDDSAPSGILRDTVGLMAFIDSLRVDALKGSVNFLLSRRAENFGGSPRFERRAGIDPLRDNADFARETAFFLTWMLQPNRVSFSFDPKRGTAIVSPGDSTNPCDPDRGNAEDNYCVWVPDTGQTLFDSIGGRSLGSINTRWVHRISIRGGQKLKHYPWTIRPEWMRVLLPDGRTGWTRGQDLDDGLGGFITLSLVHQTDGWRVRSMFTLY